MNYNHLKQFIGLVLETRLREADITDGKVPWGSDEHVTDVQNRIESLLKWRDRQRKGTETRANYSRLITRLRTELKSALRSASKNKLVATEGLLKAPMNKILLEGGLVGHLQHLYDNKDLTFKEIKIILRKASTGRLEKVSEKMDGMTLVFSYDLSQDSVKVTRGSDIKAGGMNSAALAAKFAGRGSVEEAFTGAFKVLEGAIGALPVNVKQKIFGPAANRWYSMEIIYTKNPNVVNYDSNNLVFHGWPVFKRDQSGNVEMSEDEAGGIDILTQYIDKMQNAVATSGWRVRGPSIVRMRELSNGTQYQDTVSKIDEAMSDAGASDSSTMGAYLAILLKEDIAVLKLSPNVEKMVVDRCLGTEGAPSVVDIKKTLPKEDHGKVSAFVKNSPVLLKSYVRPIELAINDFAVELLKGLGSTLIDDSSKEVDRLRGEVQNAVSAIEASGDETAMSILAQQMGKLKSVENITSPVEGVVFIYKGNAYKFTGSFAAANQILGSFKYGRKGTKL